VGAPPLPRSPQPPLEQYAVEADGKEIRAIPAMRPLQWKKTVLTVSLPTEAP
jgi:hypothetical protein